MDNKKKIIIGVSIVAAGSIAYMVYLNSQAKKTLPPAGASASNFTGEGYHNATGQSSASDIKKYSPSTYVAKGVNYVVNKIFSWLS